MSKPKTKSLPVCTCGHICRFYRSAIGSATEWRCTYCERTYSKTEALSLYPAIEVEEPTFTTDNAPIMQMFKAAPQVMAAPMPVPIVTASPVAVALVLQETAKLPELANLQEFAAGAEGILKKILTKEKIAPDLIVDKVWTPSSDGEQSFDVNELFVYHPKVEVKTSPTRMTMPTMAAPAQAPTFDTGRNQYSLRSER